jgi:sugar phosphate isomerase/epimerase
MRGDIMKKILIVAVLTALSLSPLLASAAQKAAAPPVKPIPAEVVQAVKSTDYASVRIKEFPISMECWTFRAFTFFDTLLKVKELGIKYLQAYPGQPLGGPFPKSAVFDETMSEDQMKAVQAALEADGIKVVAYGVCDIGTTEASMRKIFDFARKMGIQTVVCEPQDDDFTLLEKLIDEYNLGIAIHNHPLPAKYAHPMTVLEHVQNRSERIGSCADTGHWMRLGLNPLECLRLLDGRIRDLHLKDRSGFGTKKVDDVPWGAGKAGIRDILAELTLQDYNGFLTIEYENEKEVKDPIPAIKKSIDYVRSVTYYLGYEQLIRKDWGYYEKHGWNHYGPGYFELDPKTGVLKSQGGMGLLWFAKRKFRDFVLEVDFKCSQKTTNSGIFYRVPEVPTSDDYIYHSFEVQIYDAGEGIHKTGAIYDAEAPGADASLPTGEWNHMKITCRGKNIQIELNGKLIVNWDQEPRGKIKDFALEGYIGLQNHDSESPVYFKNIFVKEL